MLTLKAREPQPITSLSPSPRQYASLRPSKVQKKVTNKSRATSTTSQNKPQASKKQPQASKKGRKAAVKQKFTLPFRFYFITEQSKSARELRQNPTTALTPFLVNLTVTWDDGDLPEVIEKKKKEKTEGLQRPPLRDPGTFTFFENGAFLMAPDELAPEDMRGYYSHPEYIRCLELRTLQKSTSGSPSQTLWNCLCCSTHVNM